MAINTWGVTPTTWGRGNWGKQNDCTVVLTGQDITTSLGAFDAYTEAGWGGYFWGERSWGRPGTDAPVVVTGQEITLSPGTLEAYNNQGWGRLTWGEGGWGGGMVFAVTGVSATLALGNESTLSNAKVNATGQSLSVTGATIVAGSSVDPVITGLNLTAATGTFTTSIWTEINPNVSMVWTELAA